MKHARSPQPTAAIPKNEAKKDMRPRTPLNTRPLNALAAAPPSRALLHTPRCVARFQIKTNTAAYKSPRAIRLRHPIFSALFSSPRARTALRCTPRARTRKKHQLPPVLCKPPRAQTHSPLPSCRRTKTIANSLKNPPFAPVLFRARSRPYLVCCCVNGAAAFLSLFLYGNCVQVALLRGFALENACEMTGAVLRRSAGPLR